MVDSESFILTVLGYNNNPPPPPQKKRKENSTGLNSGPKGKAVFASAKKSIFPPKNHDKIADCRKVHRSQTISPPQKSTHLVAVFLPEYPPHLPTPRLALNSIVRLQGFLSHYSGHLIASASNNTKLFVTYTPAARNSFVGTAQYVSPELLTDKRAVKRY